MPSTHTSFLCGDDAASKRSLTMGIGQTSSSVALSTSSGMSTLRRRSVASSHTASRLLCAWPPRRQHLQNFRLRPPGRRGGRSLPSEAQAPAGTPSKGQWQDTGESSTRAWTSSACRAATCSALQPYGTNVTFSREPFSGAGGGTGPGALWALGHSSPHSRMSTADATTGQRAALCAKGRSPGVRRCTAPRVPMPAGGRA
mmetsp:Transcript_2776/g.8449  ORF Transcript_2776/g.8449 Transcript_2776/m.8449 type:complete len:200 (+) Transcript_2776:202-801(+)